jgi:hypothetical protein
MNEIITTLIIVLFLISYIIIFLLGILVGRLLSFNGVYKNESIQTTNKTLSSIVNKDTGQTISIDSSKFVVDIKTDGLEKKYQQLGDVKESQETIDSSVNKLKNMKG